MGRTVLLILVPSQAALYDDRLARYSPLPLALGILQAYLRAHGHAVRCADLNARLVECDEVVRPRAAEALLDPDRVLGSLGGASDAALDAAVDRLLDGMPVESSDVVGISTGANMSFFEIHLALLLGSRIRRMGTPVVFGGLNLGYLWQFRDEFEPLWTTVAREGFHAFLGPGERSFERFVSTAPGREREACYRTLPGAVFREQARLTRNSYGPPSLVAPDFTGLPLAHYTLSCDTRPPAARSAYRNLVSYYKRPYSQAVDASEANRRLPADGRRERLFVPYVFNYNCPYRCAFCVQSRADKPPATRIDAAVVVEHLEQLSREYDTPYFHFYDNAVNLSPAFVGGFCDEVQRKDLRVYWSDCARFNTVDEPMVDRLYRSGCRRLVFGLDTASSRIARLIDKGIDFAQASRVLEWCRNRGIWAEVEVIVGLPHETEDDFRATYDFLSEHAARGALNDFHVNRYFVVPESRLGAEPVRYGIRIERLGDAYRKVVTHEAARVARVRQATEAGAETLPAAPRRELPWRYREIDGRDADRIEAETEDKFRRMLALQARLASGRDAGSIVLDARCDPVSSPAASPGAPFPGNRR